MMNTYTPLYDTFTAYASYRLNKEKKLRRKQTVVRIKKINEINKIMLLYIKLPDVLINIIIELTL